MTKRKRHFIRTGHGNGKGQPHVEIPRDGMPKPVAPPVAEPSAPLVFREGHKIADSATAKEMQRRSAAARVRNLRLVDSLGLSRVAEDGSFTPYRNAADAFVEHHLAEIAALAGGKVGSGPSTMVSSAALQLAGSRFAFDRFAETADASWMKLGSSLANDSRQNLLAAYSHAVLEAQGRDHADGDRPPWLPSKAKKEDR